MYISSRQVLCCMEGPHFSLSIEARRLRHTLAAFPNPPESGHNQGCERTVFYLSYSFFIGTDLGTLMFPVCLR